MPGRQGRQADEAGLAGMCWGKGGARQARSPGRQGCQVGEASQAVMCWGDGVPGGQRRQAGEAS